MKKIFIFILFLSVVSNAFGQQNMGTVSGGYSFAKVNNSDASISGFKVSGLYEFNPYKQKWSYGLSLGYINLKGSSASRDYNISSVPICFAPKYVTGKNKLKAFIKGEFGFQFSKLEKTENSEILSDHDYGFVAGAGAGLMYSLNEKVYLNAEYELMWMSNSFYSDGWINTVSGGLGVKF
jgi:hypothetical protein